MRLKSRLTPRQRQVLQLAAGGASNSEIAAALDITLDTVRVHITDIGRRYKATGRGRTVLVLMGLACGDIDLEAAYSDVEGRRRCG